MHWLHQCVCMWEKESVGMRAASALSDETLPTFKGYFKLFPLIKFSITWVNRGQWEKNKYPHLSQRTQPSPLPANTHMHPHADTRCQPIWLPVRKSHPPRQVPFSPRTIFPRHVRYGDINECTMTVLREPSSYPASANLLQATFVRQGKRNNGNKQVRVRNSSPLPD